MNRQVKASLYFAMAVICAGLAACSRPAENVKNSDADARRPKSELVRGLGGEPGTLDPRLAADNPALALMLDLYEGLSTHGADGTVVPGAASGWTVSEDGLTWTFTLRPGLRWSDSAPLTAAHFARGIAQAKARETGAPYADLLDGISAVSAKSDGRLIVTVWRPMPYLPALLALPVAAPEPDAGSANAALPVSNGPYRLVARRPGERLELERNPNYHDAASVAVARVTYLTVEDLNTELNLYRAGELDVTSEVPNARIDWIREQLQEELHLAPYLSTYGYAVNVARLPDADARTALAMAIDREAIVAKVTGAGESPAFGWVPPGLAGYRNARFDWAALSRETRLARTAQLWQQAGARSGGAPRRITLCTDASTNHHRTAVALADQWRAALDVEVELVEMEWKVYLDRREHPADCDLVRFGWSGDFADAEAFLTLYETRHPQNTLGYSSRSYDEAMYASRRVADPAERQRQLAAAEAILLEAVPIIPVFHRVSKRLVKPYVKGVTPNALGQLASRQLRLER